MGVSSAVSPAVSKTPPCEDAHHLPSHREGGTRGGAGVERFRTCVLQSGILLHVLSSHLAAPAPMGKGVGGGEGEWEQRPSSGEPEQVAA